MSWALVLGQLLSHVGIAAVCMFRINVGIAPLGIDAESETSNREEESNSISLRAHESIPCV